VNPALEQAAHFAVWQMQFSTDRAVKYVTKRTGVSADEAQQAIRRAVLWYRG
jgi:hypothetical protein